MFKAKLSDLLTKAGHITIDGMSLYGWNRNSEGQIVLEHGDDAEYPEAARVMDGEVEVNDAGETIIDEYDYNDEAVEEDDPEYVVKGKVRITFAMRRPITEADLKF